MKTGPKTYRKTGPASSLADPAVRHPAIKRTLRYLDQHWHQPIRVHDLATASKLSARGLFKAFVRHVGCGPGRLLLRVRIQRAQQLLTETDWSLDTISNVCGFGNTNSFWVAFRRETKTTPGRYRREFGQPPPAVRAGPALCSCAGARPQKVQSSSPKPEKNRVVAPANIIRQRARVLL